MWPLARVRRLTHEKYQILDVVTLMESLQIVKSHRDDVMRIVQKTQMQHRELLAGVAFAQQMSRPFRIKNSGNHINYLWINGALIAHAILIFTYFERSSVEAR